MSCSHECYGCCQSWNKPFKYFKGSKDKKSLKAKVILQGFITHSLIVIITKYYEWRPFSLQQKPILPLFILHNQCLCTTPTTYEHNWACYQSRRFKMPKKAIANAWKTSAFSCSLAIHDCCADRPIYQSINRIILNC